MSKELFETAQDTKEKSEPKKDHLNESEQNQGEIVKRDTENGVEVISETGEVIGYGSEVYDIDPIQQNIERTKTLIGWVMSFTGPKDWVIYNNGVAYLKATGAERIATLMNIKWTRPEYITDDFKDENGKIIERLVTCRSDFTLNNGGYNRSIEGIEGYASTKDTTVNKFKMPAKEVSLKDLKKVAYSKMILEGIRRLLGIRELPVEYLPEKWRDRIEKVEFANINEMKEYIHQWLIRKSNGDGKKYKELLQKISDIPTIDQKPVTKISELNNKAIKYIYRKINK